MTSFIQERGAMLASEGYLVCAIKPGEKRPIGKDWINSPMSSDQCRSYPRDAGVGIICGKGEHPVYGIDADIEGDVEFSEDFRLNVVNAMLGDGVCYRVGKAPKFLVPVQGPAGMTKKISRWFTKNGAKCRLEFLGDGQQFVAEHIYPGTEKPYEWYGDPLIYEHLDPPEMLPAITPEQADDLVRQFEETAAKHGWEPRESSESAPASGDAALAAMLTQHRLGVSVEEIAPYVEAVEIPSNDRTTWTRLGMALNFEFAGTPSETAAIDLWDKVSESIDGYRGRASLEDVWRSFGRHKGPSVTLGWVKFVSKYSDRISQVNDLGMAYRLHKRYGGRLVYAQDAEKWFGFDGYRWVELKQGAAEEYVFSLCDGALKDEIKACQDSDRRASLEKLYYRMASATAADNVLKVAQSISGFRALASDFDTNPRWFGCANGDLDLDTFELVPPDPKHKVTKSCGIAYNRDAECKVWKQTLMETRTDPETAAAEIEHLQMYVGYALMGKPIEEVMLIAFGPGCNGKSTIINTLREAFGDYGQVLSADALASTFNRGSSAGSARSDIVSLQGSRFVVASETEQNARLKEATIKQLVSTDAIKARKLFEDDRVFKSTWAIVMATNHIPNIYGTDDGIWRRLQLIGFKRNFNTDPNFKKDLHRADRLRDELPGILAWIVRGAMKYKEAGRLSPPPSVVKETAKYRKEMDVLAEWLEDRCEVDAAATVLCADAYNSWKVFADTNGYRKAQEMSSKKFGMAMRERGYELLKKGGKRCYAGFKLKDSIV